MDEEPDYFTYFVDKPNIHKFSSPIDVQKKAFELLGKNAKIAFSPRKTKKYVIYNPITNKYVHFGEMGYQDATKHKNLDRIRRFRLRNAKWKDAPKYSPAFLSYYILWD